MAIATNAQFMRAKELEKYAKEKYGDNGLRHLLICYSQKTYNLTKITH